MLDHDAELGHEVPQGQHLLQELLGDVVGEVGHHFNAWSRGVSADRLLRHGEIEISKLEILKLEISKLEISKLEGSICSWVML